MFIHFEDISLQRRAGFSLKNIRLLKNTFDNKDIYCTITKTFIFFNAFGISPTISVTLDVHNIMVPEMHTSISFHVVTGICTNLVLITDRCFSDNNL